MAGRHLPAGEQGPPSGRASDRGRRHIIFIGHKGHPEVIGTLGQVPEGTITLVETVEDVRPALHHR
jgi:4-hydroxy-3-methylbut-2-enyl diphosphate reductase IspH